MSSQGCESNRSGKWLEKNISEEFKLRGVPSFRFSKKSTNNDLFFQRFLLKGVPYTSIYKSNSKSEFVYIDRDRHSIRIECRHQDSRGSVDEKFPYLLDNARRAMPEKEIWLVVEGHGARAKARAWLKEEAAAVRHKTIRMLTLSQARKLIRELPTGTVSVALSLPGELTADLFHGAYA